MQWRAKCAHTFIEIFQVGYDGVAIGVVEVSFEVSRDDPERVGPLIVLNLILVSESPTRATSFSS